MADGVTMVLGIILDSVFMSDVGHHAGKHQKHQALIFVTVKDMGDENIKMQCTSSRQSYYQTSLSPSGKLLFNSQILSALFLAVSWKFRS